MYFAPGTKFSEVNKVLQSYEVYFLTLAKLTYLSVGESGTTNLKVLRFRKLESEPLEPQELHRQRDPEPQEPHG